MNVELLPNEIFHDLFEYFDCVEFIHAFYGLNSRFNDLLYKQFRGYRLDFRSVSKRKFDMICQQHLPFIADRVISLSLANYNDTPEQINLFNSYIPSFRQFTHLRSLSIFNLHSYQTLLKLLENCHNLNNLTRLKFFMCSFSNDQANFQLIVDSIWSLSKLSCCYFDIRIEKKRIFYIPTVISSSLEVIDIMNSKLQLNQINRLFCSTPRLKNLRTSIECISGDDYVVSPLPTLIKMNLLVFLESDASNINILLRNMPELRHLDIDILYELIDGHQWEEIIRNYLPKLKTFRLCMEKDLSFTGNIQERVEKLVDSFRSSFWIDEHQWFVRCFVWKKTIHLHTLFDTFKNSDVMFPDLWQSTYLHDIQQDFYNSMTYILDETLFDQAISSHVHLINIDYLHIEIPINDQFWSVIPNLNRLYSLTVSSHADTFQSQLQALLDRAPHLEILTISQDANLPLQTSLFKYINRSVRELNLQNYNHQFNTKECFELSHSPLGAHCEVLYICVDSCESIISLVENMHTLRALIIKCADDIYCKSLSFIQNNDNEYLDENKLIHDEIIQWLKDHLSSTYLIVRDSKVDSNILIWI